MRSHIVLLIAILACIQMTAWACDMGSDTGHNGCKIYRDACTCGFGCKTEYIYRTRRACLNALRGSKTVHINYQWSKPIGLEAETAKHGLGIDQITQHRREGSKTVLLNYPSGSKPVGLEAVTAKNGLGFGQVTQHRYGGSKTVLLNYPSGSKPVGLEAVIAKNGLGFGQVTQHRYGVRNANPCSRLPCNGGICIQTMQDPGYNCKCEGTGFYGQRCEKACPSEPVRGAVFPHECIVI